MVGMSAAPLPNLASAIGRDVAQVPKSCDGCNKPMELFVRTGCEEEEEEEEEDGVDYSEGTLDQVNKSAWEALPRPIIFESGASTSVMPLTWSSHVRTTETEASRRGEH